MRGLRNDRAVYIFTVEIPQIISTFQDQVPIQLPGPGAKTQVQGPASNTVGRAYAIPYWVAQ
jgi:hypothetical protein